MQRPRPSFGLYPSEVWFWIGYFPPTPSHLAKEIFCFLFGTEGAMSKGITHLPNSALMLIRASLIKSVSPLERKHHGMPLSHLPAQTPLSSFQVNYSCSKPFIYIHANTFWPTKSGRPSHSCTWEQAAPSAEFTRTYS